MSLDEVANRIIALSSTDDVDGMIDLLRRSTTPTGPMHPNNEQELNLWNLAGWDFNLRRGKYQQAEKIYRAFYEALLEQQKTMGHVHKGMPLHNLGLALFFQGKIHDSIKFFLCAYIEDLIRAQGNTTVDQAPASKVIRSFFGIPQKDLSSIKEIVLKETRDKTPLNPEDILSIKQTNDLLSNIEKRYTTNIPDTWKWEIEAQKAIEGKDYTKAFKIYDNWFNKLLAYQKEIGDIVYKAHPLFGAGQALLRNENFEEAPKFLFLSFIEEIIAETKKGDAKNSPSFRMLSSSQDIRPNLEKIETLGFTMKDKGADLSNPESVLNDYGRIEALMAKDLEDTEKDIIATRDTQKKELETALRQGKALDSNVLYILKQWNSATPRFPHKTQQSFGGGFFLTWNNKGIVIDPGYDFLKHFYNQGFGPRNIDLIIVTHAHEDHCQDLEPIFSALYKYNRDCEEHKVDLIVSEGTDIKYGRLLEINSERIHTEILLQGKPIDVDKVFKKDYKLSLKGTPTIHHESPWMKNNTGAGVIITLESSPVLKIGFTSDTAFWNELPKEFSGTNLIIANIGTYGESENHLCQTGCLELIKGCVPAPNLVVVSEFGEELKGKRVKVCTQIETSAMWQTVAGRIPVIAGDVGLRISIPQLKIFCENTKTYEDCNLVIDNEDSDGIKYNKVT